MKKFIIGYLVCGAAFVAWNVSRGGPKTAAAIVSGLLSWPIFLFAILKTK